MKKQKGITLIALIVTIIVLLILAGVSISTIIRENGIFNKAEEGKENNQIAIIKERAELAKEELIIESKKNIKELQRSELTNKLLKEFKNSTQQGYSAIVENGKYIVEVDSDLEINVYKYGGKVLEDGEIGLYVKEYTSKKDLEVARIDVEVQIGGIVPYEYYVTEFLKDKTIEEKEQCFIENYKENMEKYYPGEEVSVKNILKVWMRSEYETLEEYYKSLGYKDIDEYLIKNVKIKSKEYTNKKIAISVGSQSTTVTLTEPTTFFAISHNGTYVVNASYENSYASQSIEISNIKNKKIYELDKEDENTYLIKNIEDLVGFQQNINRYIDTYEGKTVKLANDLDFNDDKTYKNPNDKSFGDLNKDGIVEGIKKEVTTGKGFDVIGPGLYAIEDIRLYVRQAFLGDFNGNNKTIRNLYIKNKKDDKKDNSDIGLFGILIENTIQNLTITGDIIIEESYNRASVGAIAGYNQYGTIENCNSYVNIKVDNGLSNSVAGIVGEGILMNILNSNNYGNMESIWYGEKEDETASNIGGIIGYSTFTSQIENCNNYGDLKLKQIKGHSEGGYCGGIVGLNAYSLSSIKQCNNYGDLQLIAEEEAENVRAYVGGIIGNNNQATIEKCYNKGNISNSAKGKYIYAGGITGYSGQGEVNQCFNEGQIKNQGAAIIDGGSCQVGGIVSSNTGGSATTKGNVINNCYNIGEIINNGEGNLRTGGIAGYCSTGSEINNSYNIKNIQIGKTEITEKDKIGSIIGELQGTTQNCYYLENTYTQGNGNKKEGTIVKTKEEMKTTEFLNLLNNGQSNIWKLVENQNQGYPILNWQN